MNQLEALMKRGYNIIVEGKGEAKHQESSFQVTATKAVTREEFFAAPSLVGLSPIQAEGKDLESALIELTNEIDQIEGKVKSEQLTLFD